MRVAYAFLRLTQKWATATSVADLSPSITAAVLSIRRHYVPKIFLRHDIMKSVLARFLDAKGVPQDAIQNVVATKHYYAFPKSEFEHFERVVVWWSTIGLHEGEDMGRILRRFPNILWMDINLLESKMQWFLSELKFQRHEIGALLTQNPNLLFHHAEVLGHFLQLLETTGLQRHEIQQLIRDDATILEFSENVEELQSLMKWLTTTLEIRDEDCGRMLHRVPQLLDPRHHEELPHLYEYLYRMGLRTQQIGKAFVQNPHFLISRRMNVQSLFRTLKKNLHLRQRDLAEMALQCPRLLSADREHLEERVVFLRDAVGLESVQMCSFVQKHPAILIAGFERTLLPRFLFLKTVVNVPPSDISAHPKSLTHKLDFLMQRFGFLDKITTSQTRPSLQEVLDSSDLSFSESLGRSLSNYRRFLSDWQRPRRWTSALEKALLQELDRMGEHAGSD